MHKAFKVNLPTAHLEIKIVSAILFCRSRLNAAFRCLWILLRESLKGVQEDKHTAHRKIIQNALDVHHSLLDNSSNRLFISLASLPGRGPGRVYVVVFRVKSITQCLTQVLPRSSER